MATHFIRVNFCVNFYQNQAIWQVQWALMMGICQTSRALHLTANNTPQGITDKLHLIYQWCEHLQMALSTHVKVMRLIYDSKTMSSCPLNPLISNTWEVSKTFINIPMVWSRDWMVSLFSLHFWPCSQDVKIFLSHLTTVRSVIKLDLTSLYPLAYQLDG